MTQNPNSVAGSAGTAETVDQLKHRVVELESKLERIQARRTAFWSTGLTASSWLVNQVLGTNVIQAGTTFSAQLQSWQEGKRQHPPLAEGVNLTVTAIARFVRVGVITLLIALIPSSLLIIQTWLFANQNSKFDMQNQLIGQDVALTAFEQSSRFRDLFSIPPRPLVTSARHRGDPRLKPQFLSAPRRTVQGIVQDYPDPYEEGESTKWPSPRRSSVIQIAMLADSQPDLVVKSLIPLLSDSDGVVAAGALLSLRDILHNRSDVRDRIKELLPIGSEQPIDLRDVHIVDEDLSLFAGTELFYNANFARSVIQNVNFEGLMLKGSEFAFTTVLESSFKGTNLVASRWHNARVRATSFESANLFQVYAEDADFGVQALRRDSFFIPVSFAKAIMNDAKFNRSSLVSVRLQDAQLHAMEISKADLSGAWMKIKGEKKLVTAEALAKAGAVFSESAKYDKEGP